MPSLNEYLDAAKTAQGLSSDRQLNTMLGYKSNTISFFRTGKAFPSDEVMLKIAEMGKRDQTLALLDLNCWRTSEKSRSFYAKIREMVEKSALTAAAVAILAPSAFAGTAHEQVNISENPSIYYHFNSIVCACPD